MALRMLAATLVIASGAKRRTNAVPSTDCIVTSTTVDGTEEKRDCYLLSEAEMQPGTKGRFQSCTQ